MEWVRSRRTLVVGVSLVLGYVVLGYTILPHLLIPVGCEGGYGDLAVVYTPNAEFNISYDSAAAAVTVNHTGGDTLPAARTDTLELQIESTNHTRTYSWTAAGGSFPVRPGDSVTITDASVNGRQLMTGDDLRVYWAGEWPDPQPNYCPNDHPTDSARYFGHTSL